MRNEGHIDILIWYSTTDIFLRIFRNFRSLSSVQYFWTAASVFSELPTLSPVYILRKRLAEHMEAYMTSPDLFKSLQNGNKGKNMAETLVSVIACKPNFIWSYKRCAIRWTNLLLLLYISQGNYSYDWVHM